MQHHQLCHSECISYIILVLFSTASSIKCLCWSKRLLSRDFSLAIPLLRQCAHLAYIHNPTHSKTVHNYLVCGFQLFTSSHRRCRSGGGYLFAVPTYRLLRANLQMQSKVDSQEALVMPALTDATDKCTVVLMH